MKSSPMRWVFSSSVLRGAYVEHEQIDAETAKKICSCSKYFEHEQTAVPDMLVKKVPVCCMVQCSVRNEGKRRSVSEELSLWVGEWSWNINIDMWRPYLMRVLEVRRRNLNWISYETQGQWRFQMAGSMWCKKCEQANRRDLNTSNHTDIKLY